MRSMYSCHAFRGPVVSMLVANRTKLTTLGVDLVICQSKLLVPNERPQVQVLARTRTVCWQPSR